MRFLHGILRRILQRVILPQENKWDSLKNFDFVSKELLINEQLMVKKSFNHRAFTVVESQIDVEMNKNKNGGSRGAEASVIAEKFLHIIDACRELLRHLCSGLLPHNTWKSDLVAELASFDYASQITMPKSQSLESFEQFFEKFGDKKAVSKDMQSDSTKCYNEFLMVCDTCILMRVKKHLKWKTRLPSLVAAPS